MAVTGGPARAEAVGPTRLALLIGIVLAAQDNTNRPLGVVILLALAVLLGLSLQWDLGLVVIAALAVAGVAMRLDLLHAGTSDVLTVTRSAIETVLAGGNPYGIGYATSSPPGAPFPYGPLALAWYVPFQGDPRVVETAVSFLVLAAAGGPRAAARPGRVRPGAAPDPHRPATAPTTRAAGCSCWPRSSCCRATRSAAPRCWRWRPPSSRMPPPGSSRSSGGRRWPGPSASSP